MNDQVFHVYKKNTNNTEVVAHSLSVDELEQRLVDKSVDMSIHEIQPCQVEYNEASYWTGTIEYLYSSLPLDNQMGCGL